MHEFSLVQNIILSVNKTAENAGALRVNEVRLIIGEMTEVVDEAMRFAFEALTEGTISEGARLEMDFRAPRSRCLECGTEFDHSRYNVTCTECGSWATELLQGRELYIDSIDVDLPDE